MPKIKSKQKTAKHKASLNKQGPRVRVRHPDSEGESESECSDIGYRALRKDENPEINGIRPPAGSDPNISAYAHVRNGSKAKIKSNWVSYSRSLKVAGSWAANDIHGRVAKFRITKSQKVYDLTEVEDQQRFLSDYSTQTGEETNPDPKKHPAINFAKGSQEGLIYNGVEASDVIAIYKAKRISDETFREFSMISPPSGSRKLIKSRTTVTEKKLKTLPKATLLEEIYHENTKEMPDSINQGLPPYDVDYISHLEER